MTAIYDHLGNYLGDDGNPEMPTTSVDQMRYELSMMPLRPDGSDVPYTAQELRNMPVPARQPEPPRPYSTATNVAQAVADRLGLSAIPQAALGMASSFPAAIAKELGYPRVAEALQYTPSSRAGTDILEAAAAAPEAITGSHMGFGPLAEYWVPKSGFGLQSRPVITPSDVSVLGGRAIARGREVAAIPEDFRAAQAGLRRESDLGGPTYGARLQDVTEGLGDYLARQEAMRYSYEPSGSVQVFGNMVPETNLYAVRPSGTSNQVLREVPTPLNPRYNVSGESRLTGDLADILDREEPTTNIEVGTRVQPFTNFVPNNFDKSANDLFRDFIMPKLALEFPGLQNENLLRAAQVKYGTGLQDWMKAQIEEFAQLPEVKAYNKAAIDTIENDYTLDNPAATLRDVMIVPPSVKLAGAQAAENWVMQNMQNYMTEYLGTEADPALQEVMKSGKTVVPQQELEHFANDNARTAQGFRTRAGLPTEGVVRPKLVNVSNEQNTVNQRLEQIQNEFNALVAANPGTRPADIPGIKELYKEQKTLTKVKDKLEEQAANLKKAVMYEDYMDARVRPVGEKALVEDINPTELQRFPMIPTNKELMYQMYVPDAFKELGREIVNKLEAGLITPEAAKNLSVPTAIKMKAELTIKKEKLAQEAAKLETEQLKSYIIEETQTLPQDGRYGKGVVVKFDDTLSKDQMERVLSSECEFMDHCIGRGGTPDDRVLSRKAKALGPGNVGSDDKYVGYIPMIAPHKPGRVVPKGSSGTATGYMKEFLEGKAVGRSFRDEATGVPFATMKLTRIEDGDNAGKYRINEFYGYKDRQVDGPWYEGREGGYSVDEKKEYRQVIADWANDHSDQLKAVSNDHLYRFAQIYDGQSTDHKNVLAHVLGVKPEQVSDIVQQVGKRFVTEDEAKAAKIALREAPTNELEALKETKADLERAIRNGNFIDDEEEMVLRSQLQEITDEIRGLQQRNQVVPQQIEQVRQYMTWVNDRHPDTQGRLAQITEDLDDLSAGRIMPRQHDLHTMADTEMFIRALGDEQRRLLAEQDNQAIPRFIFEDNYQQFIPSALQEARNRLDQLGRTVFDAAYEGTRNSVSFADDPRGFVAGLRNRANILEDANPNYEDIARELNYLAAVHNGYFRPNPNFDDQPAPAQLPAPAAQVDDLDTELFSATNIIRENYNDTIANVVDSITDGVTNQVGSINDNPRLWIDTLRRDSLNYANRTREALDGLANTLETAYVNQNWPIQDAPAQPPATTDAYAVVRRAHTPLVEAGDIEAMTGIANNIMTNRNGVYAQLTDNERTALRAQLEDGIRDARANQEPTPLSDIIQMDMNRIRDTYDEEVYNTVDGALTAINDDYHIEYDPALFIERVNRLADRALADNDTTMHSIYQNLSSILTRTLRDNNAISAARRQEVTQAEGPTDLASAYQAFLDEIESGIEEGSFDPGMYSNDDLAQLILDDQVGGNVGNIQSQALRERLAEEVRQHGIDTYHEVNDDIEEPAQFTVRANPITLPEGLVEHEINLEFEQIAGRGLLTDAQRLGLEERLAAITQNRTSQEMMNDLSALSRTYSVQGSDNLRSAVRGIINRIDAVQRNATQRDELAQLENAQAQQLPALRNYEPAEDPGLALPVPAPAAATAEQQAMDEALQFPRFWQQRYPGLATDLVSAILTRAYEDNDLPGLRVAARNRTRGSIFEGLSHNDRNLAVRMIDEIGNRYQNELQRLDNRPEGRKRGGHIKMRKGGRPYRKEDYPMDPKYLMPELPAMPPSIMQGLTREEEFDDGAFNFRGSKSDQLGLTPRVFPRYPESDTSPQSHMSRERGTNKPSMQYYSNGGINKVRPTPNIPATPAKQNPNTTDYVPNKPVDKGFKETLEKIRGRSNDDLPDNYRAGGSISIDEMKYALMKGR